MVPVVICYFNKLLVLYPDHPFMLATSLCSYWCVMYCIKYVQIILLFQALYYCIPFREQLLEYYANYRNPGDAEENLLTCLADLFAQVKIQILLLADILLHLIGCCSKKSIRVPTLSLTSQCTHGFHVIIKFEDDNLEDYWFYFKYMLTNR